MCFRHFPPQAALGGRWKTMTTYNLISLPLGFCACTGRPKRFFMRAGGGLPCPATGCRPVLNPVFPFLRGEFSDDLWNGRGGSSGKIVRPTIQQATNTYPLLVGVFGESRQFLFPLVGASGFLEAPLTLLQAGETCTRCIFGWVVQIITHRKRCRICDSVLGCRCWGF